MQLNRICFKLERDINLTASEISLFVDAGARKSCFPLDRDPAPLPCGELCAFLLLLASAEDNTSSSVKGLGSDFAAKKDS